MIQKFLTLIGEKYPLTSVDAGEFKTLKASGMKFDISAYDAKGLGRVSVMQAKGFFGLMKMFTLIVTPTDIDLPLYSYDRIFAFGNDVLISEVYDTCAAGEFSQEALKAVTDAYAGKFERDPGQHWYDSIKFETSISKKAKKRFTKELDELAEKHFKAYLETPSALVEGETALKKAEKTAYYVNGLLDKGGPSTDAFVKSLGREKTETLFKKILF